MPSDGDITTQPNPPLENQSVVIVVPHSGPWSISLDGSGVVTRYTPNERGEVDLPAPPGGGGQSFTVSDGNSPGNHATFEISSNE